MSKGKHENYEILNLIGYGLSKFDNELIKQFGFSTKISFYQFFVDNKIVETASTVKNRMDLFDPFFPSNGRQGWWQKGDAYIHRKILIDSLFGNENVEGYANIIKTYLKDKFPIEEANLGDIYYQEVPIIQSKFKKLQETGLEAELFFMNNYDSVDIFKDGSIEDARLYGDGYDFQVSVNEHLYLAEIKGVRESKGKFRLTENEYKQALKHKDNYIVSVILNLNQSPTVLTIENPIKNLSFDERIVNPRAIKEYHLSKAIC